MGGLAHGGVVHVQVVANRPYHDFAGIESHTRLHLQAVGAADVLRIAAHGRLHGEGSVTGPHGVIFVGDRGAEERHDAVAEDLVHGAFVAVHGVHHHVQRRRPAGPPQRPSGAAPPGVDDGLGAADGCDRRLPAGEAPSALGVARLTATLGPVPGAPALVRVELRAEPVPGRRLVPVRTRLRVGAGLTVGAGVAAVAPGPAGLDGTELLLTAAGAAGAVWAGTSALRAAKEARAALGDALAYALDKLEHRRTWELVQV